MELNLDRLELGRTAFPLDESLILSQPETSQPVRVHGELLVDAMDQKVLVTGSFEAERSVACDRCARIFTQTTAPEIEVMILRNPSRADAPEDEEDAWVVHQPRGSVQLDGALLEAVALDEPQQALCRDDCRGLCPQCGIDLNDGSCDCPTEPIDSRWAKLAQLRDLDAE